MGKKWGHMPTYACPNTFRRYLSFPIKYCHLNKRIWSHVPNAFLIWFSWKKCELFTYSHPLFGSILFWFTLFILSWDRKHWLTALPLAIYSNWPNWSYNLAQKLCDSKFLVRFPPKTHLHLKINTLLMPHLIYIILWNVPWSWLSQLRGWGSLTMAFTGKFVYIAHHFILLQLNPFDLRVDREHCVIVAGLVVSRGC